jgi:hypothetical protein
MDIPTPEGKIIHWIAPVAGTEETSPVDVITTLIGENGIFGLSTNAGGKKQIGKGDWIAFYAARIGIVAHAQVAEQPRPGEPSSPVDCQFFPTQFRVTKAKVYGKNPVILDENKRRSLDAFVGKDAISRWAWFVQGMHRISPLDFGRITRGS